MSRVTRSASAFTVSSMIFFCSSVNLSHLASSVAVNPLTLVSGERSSWATVETRSARLRSARSRASVSRKATTSRTNLPPSRTYRQVASTSRSPAGRASTRRCSGLRVTPGIARSRALAAHQSWPRSSDKPRT